MYTRFSVDLGMRDACVRRDSDGAVIPADPENHDWQVYQTWLKAGNAPAEPASEPPPARRPEA